LLVGGDGDGAKGHVIGRVEQRGGDTVHPDVTAARASA
jgi:hypothetical protein